MTVQQTIVEYKKQNPNATPEEIANYVRRKVPGARTTAGSVACTLNRAGLRAGKITTHDELPTFQPNGVTEADVPEQQETDDQIRERINVRFKAMERLGPKCVAGKLNSLIVSGPPGVGKTWTMDEAVAKSGRVRHDGVSPVGGGAGVEGVNAGYYDQIQGGASAVGLFMSLWHMRSGGLLYVNDCDNVFRDEGTVNLLKIATDTTKERLVSWRKNAAWLDEYEIDRTFDFRGHIIFLTNIDFEEAIKRNHQMTEHFKALIDRAAYLCLTMRTARDFLVRIRDVAGGKDGFLVKPPYNLDLKVSNEILDFVAKWHDKFYNLSLRLVGQLAQNYILDREHWQVDAMATKMRTL